MQIYLYCNNGKNKKPVRTENLAGNIYVDFDSENNVIGVDVFDVDKVTRDGEVIADKND